MKKLTLDKFGVKEMNASEMKDVEGGKVPLWLYLMAPGSAYLMEKFEKGCECDIVK